MKNILLITIALFTVSITNGQVLYDEDFETYTLGNLGTDFTGVTPGQGGWLTLCSPIKTKDNSLFTITNEPNKGNVLTLSSGTATPTNISNLAKKTDLNTLIDNRNSGNNVIKFEVEYYTGAQPQPDTYGQSIVLAYDAADIANTRLISYLFHFANQIAVYSKDDISGVNLGKSNTLPKIPYSTWMTLIVYLDYNNKKAYFETPYFNTIAVADFLTQSTSTNLIEDFKPTVLAFRFVSQGETTTVDMVNKYDNIKITALKSVPPYVLSAANFLAEKFNLYPNPATNVVTITNNENRLVNKIEVYDTTGKLISTQSFTNEAEIQLNVENLASGTYMLHLQTGEGTAVKKLVKK